MAGCRRSIRYPAVLCPNYLDSQLTGKACARIAGMDEKSFDVMSHARSGGGGGGGDVGSTG